jgi:predicted HNH restriction endonuclease
MRWKWTQVDISWIRAAVTIFSSHTEGKTETYPHRERERDKIKKNAYVDKLTNNKIRWYTDILKKYIKIELQRRLWTGN